MLNLHLDDIPIFPVFQWIGFHGKILTGKPMGFYHQIHRDFIGISGSNFPIIQVYELFILQVLHMGVSENSVPLNPMVFMIIIPMKNGYFIGKINPTFSDKPIWKFSRIHPSNLLNSPAPPAPGDVSNHLHDQQYGGNGQHKASVKKSAADTLW